MDNVEPSSEKLGPLEESHGRMNVLSALEGLSSTTQRQLWLQGDEESEWLFDLYAHTLLDDHDILESPHARIGDTHLDIFRNTSEANATLDTAMKFLALVKKLGDVEAKHYVRLPDWDEISHAAEVALQKMNTP